MPATIPLADRERLHVRRRRGLRLRDHGGTRRTANSFRHVHISQQLVAGVDVPLPAKNTGTSLDMVERFYRQVKLERMGKVLRLECRRRGMEVQTQHLGQTEFCMWISD
jgi:hypothetical protein